MEPHEYYSRNRAFMPSKMFIPGNGTRIGQSSIIIILAVTLFCVPATSLIEHPSSIPWSNLKINGQIDNIISDDRDGSVFVSMNGDIFKFSNELKLLSSTLTSTSSKVTSNETDHNIITNKVLSIIKKVDTRQDLLFSCWKSKDNLLKCSLIKLNELKSAPLSWSNGTKGFKTSLTEIVKLLPSQTDSNDLLIIASRYETDVDTSTAPYLPAISRFKIQKNPKYFSLELKAKAVLHNLSKLNILQEYIYIFSHNSHTYFLLNQKPTVTSLPNDDDQYSVRIARMCNNDATLFSYTEITLSCDNRKNIHAKNAYLVETAGRESLYVVFEPTGGSVTSKGYFSSLCSYSMDFIDDKFDKAISHCHQGDPNSRLLMKYIANVDSPPFCQSNPTSQDEWCLSKFNSFIDGTSYRYSVEESSHLKLAGMNSINFVYTVQQGSEQKEVFFIGSESGYLTKMSNTEELLYTIDFNNLEIKNYKIGEQFEHKLSGNQTKMARYSASSHGITVTSGEMISQIDMNACHYYSCQACLTWKRVDPLGCVWCGSTCTRDKDCGQHSTNCPPVVKSFYPLSGPISGSTKLTIRGENFGSAKGSLKVKLNEQDCLVDSRADDGETIECFTKSTDLPINATIIVEVSDYSTSIGANGTLRVDAPFAYLMPKVYGLSPKTGSLSSGSILNIYGENLDIGSNRSVYLGALECEVNEIQNNKIRCLTKPLPPTHNHNSSKVFPLKVLIDGHSQLLEQRDEYATQFTYIPYDPTNVPPTTTAAPNTNENPVPVDGTHEEQGFPFIFLSIVIILIMISLVAFYLIRYDKLPHLKLKIPRAFETKGDKVSDIKVAYRSPNPNSIDPINGLVKLNGSIMSSDYFCKPEQLGQDQPLMNTFIDSEMASILMQEKILIDRNRLTLGHVLGSGQFGRVYKGFFKVDETGDHVDVAVKTLHNKSSWDDDLDNRAFLEEGLMMKDFDHENVLALIGVTFDSNGLPMVITPFMLYGDLRSYISDEASSPTVKELIDFGTQIAKGMAYLSGLKFVHRDLAARNCMLDENMTVKVADFGLSRDIYERDYYSSDNKKAKLPVKWMAIESLATCIYNTKTDVWSYGVVLWELMTRGVVPYPDVDNFDLFSYLKEGRRMLRPRYCPLILYKIMLSCWSENPVNRPTFAELVQKVSDVITQLKEARDGQQKVSREVTYCDVLKNDF